MVRCICCHLTIVGESNKELVDDGKWSHKVCPRVQAHGECSICLMHGSHLEKTPCGHVFHAECLGKWRNVGIKSSVTCPVCRADISTFETRRMNPPRASVKRNYIEITFAEDISDAESMVPYTRHVRRRVYDAVYIPVPFQGFSWDNPIVID